MLQSASLSDPEFTLAAACCRWPLSDEAIAAIRSACVPTLDWPHFLQVVTRQRVAGLVQNALLAAGIELPPEAAQQLAARAKSIARLSLALVAETMRLQRAFDAAGISVMVVKGAALAQLAYGSLSIKHSKDIDFFVAPAHVEAALRLLEAEGYALTLPAAHLSESQRRAFIQYGREVELVHRDSGLHVELKWKLADNPMLLKGIGEKSPTQRVALRDEVNVSTLAEGDRFAYLCVHGARHAWFRLKWLADLNALVATKTDADIVRLYRHAQSVGAGLCAGQALLLCHRLLNLWLPADLQSELQNSRRLKKLMAIALRAMADPVAETEADTGIAGAIRGVFRRFLSGQGMEFYLAQCRIESVGLADVVRLALPPSLHFLYPIIRVPRWLWRRGVFAGPVRPGR